MKYKIIICTLIMMIALGFTTTACADESQLPDLPALCYGTVNINGEPAPEGTVIEAVVDGEVKGIFIVDEAGKVGGPQKESKMTVEGDLDGMVVEFYLSGDIDGQSFSEKKAGEQMYWGSGNIEEFNLNAEIDIPVSGTGPGGEQQSTHSPPVTMVKGTDVTFMESESLVLDTPSRNLVLNFENIGFTLNIETETEVSGVSVDITGTESRPDNVKDQLPGMVYMYLIIEVHDIDPANIRNADIHFSLEDEWFQNNGLDAEQMVLARYSDNEGAWSTLETSIAGNENGRVYFVSQTSGFSVFAITVTDIVSDEPVTVPDESLPETPADDPEGVEAIPGFGFSLAVIGMLAAAGFTVKRKK